MSYLHKLRSGRTYGAKSQATSDSPVSSASNQHLMLLPTVLDTLFPYLHLDDLKNCRLTCSLWNVLCIPLIARKKLDPVDFSAISNKDFLDLESEFIEVPTKVQFFQGFRLKWAEMIAMIWSNFLDSFKPRALVISGKVISDPWTNLGHLLLPVSRTLTHLDVDTSNEYYCPPFTTLLNDLVNLEGLRLKFLKLGPIYNSNWFNKDLDDYKRALEKLFNSQCGTLEELYLDFSWFLSTADHLRLGSHQIHLPIFPRLHSLDLILKEKRPIGLDSSIFDEFDFSLIFPKLEQLTILDSLLFEMKNQAILFTRGHPLKKLEITRDSEFKEQYGDILLALSISFPYIEDFSFFDRGEMEVPWMETLRSMEIIGIRERFDFKHLKKLEDLKCIFCPYDTLKFTIPSMIDILTHHLQQLPHLKSIRLSYHDKEEVMEEIRQGVPAQFRDILTIDLTLYGRYNIYNIF